MSIAGLADDLYELEEFVSSLDDRIAEPILDAPPPSFSAIASAIAGLFEKRRPGISIGIGAD